MRALRCGAPTHHAPRPYPAAIAPRGSRCSIRAPGRINACQRGDGSIRASDSDLPKADTSDVHESDVTMPLGLTLFFSIVSTPLGGTARTGSVQRGGGTEAVPQHARFRGGSARDPALPCILVSHQSSNACTTHTIDNTLHALLPVQDGAGVESSGRRYATCVPSAPMTSFPGCGTHAAHLRC